MRKPLLALALALGLALPAIAATLACPDLSEAVQIATCPSEEELKYTFTGYCGADARLYARDTDTCASYQNYRKLKNVALWESADGAFQAYLSCELPATALKGLRAVSVDVTRHGTLTRLACNYPDGVTFTHRTKAQCTVRGDGRCAANPGACSAHCD